MNDFFDVVRHFLLDYLPKQRCLSENTICLLYTSDAADD